MVDFNIQNDLDEGTFDLGMFLICLRTLAAESSSWTALCAKLSGTSVTKCNRDVSNGKDQGLPNCLQLIF